MNSEKLRCVVVGLGNQAFEHLQAAQNHPDVLIVAGVDQDVQRHYKATSLLTDMRCFFSLQELHESKLEFDAFILALPHHVYASIWQNILDFKKPLLKEKPLGRDYQEAKHFMSTAQASGCYLQTAIQRRQHPSYQFLASFIKQNGLRVDEIHAHLHLGKGGANNGANLGWRNDRKQAGGGALLDAGYHLVDLLQYLIGDFEVVSATMWNDGRADNGDDLEDRSWLFACTSQTWIAIDTWVRGLPDGQGGFIKSELVNLKTDMGIIVANREGVWLDDKKLFGGEKQWQLAMQAQLSNFANNVRAGRWDEDVIWDQLPAMRKIEEAYWLSSRY